jgi:hypothetical protein
VHGRRQLVEDLLLARIVRPRRPAAAGHVQATGDAPVEERSGDKADGNEKRRLTMRVVTRDWKHVVVWGCEERVAVLGA